MRGFTMVELILVIVVAGILAAVVGPRFFDRQVFDQRLFYEESLAAVRYGQKLALASGCFVQVNLSAAGYQLNRAANCNSGAFNAAVLKPDGEVGYANLQVPAGVVISSTGFPVVFDSLGRPAAAASANVGNFTISVAAVTGLVQ